jgi:hypothetical protein
MTPRIPTIKRRASWGKWANYYAVDEDGRRHIFALIQEPCKEYCTGQWLNTDLPTAGNIYQRVRGPRLSRDWRETLRRIIP